MQKQPRALVGLFIAAAAIISPACKSLFLKSDPERQAEKLSIDCAQGQIASDPKLKLGSIRTDKWTNDHPDGFKVQSTGELQKDPKSIIDPDDPKNYQGCSKPKGRRVLYHDTGSKYSKGSFDNEGRRQDIWAENYKNGSPAATGDYAAGKKKGFWVF